MILIVIRMATENISNNGMSIMIMTTIMAIVAMMAMVLVTDNCYDYNNNDTFTVIIRTINDYKNKFNHYH